MLSAGGVTVLVAWIAPVPSLSAKVTVEEPGGVGVHWAYTVILPLTVVDAVKGVPEPSAVVFQPPKVYPLRKGLPGKSVTVVAGAVTVLAAQFVSVPSFIVKVTV
jgi:hypothetical protein